MELGAEINHVNAENECSSIWLACYHGHMDLIVSLMGLGVDPNVPDKFGWSSIYVASSNGHKDVVVASWTLGRIPIVRYESMDCPLRGVLQWPQGRGTSTGTGSARGRPKHQGQACETLFLSLLTHTHSLFLSLALIISLSFQTLRWIPPTSQSQSSQILWSVVQCP